MEKIEYDYTSKNFEPIKFGYEMRDYSLREMVEFVERGLITEDEFHWITSYSYNGIKKSRGW